MKYEKPFVILCTSDEKFKSSEDSGSTSCALSLGCCVLTLYKK